MVTKKVQKVFARKIFKKKISINVQEKGLKKRLKIFQRTFSRKIFTKKIARNRP